MLDAAEVLVAVRDELDACRSLQDLVSQIDSVVYYVVLFANCNCGCIQCMLEINLVYVRDEFRCCR